MLLILRTRWEPPNSRLPKALAEYGRQPTISISPADRPKPRDLPFREREGWKELRWQLFRFRGRKRKLPSWTRRGEGETKGKGGGGARKARLSRYRAGLAGPLPSPGGRPHQPWRCGARKAGGAVSRSGAEFKVSSRGGGSSAPSPHPASLPGKRRLNWKGAENRRRARRGHQAAPITQASGRRPASRSVWSGAGSAAASRGPSSALSGATLSPPTAVPAQHD